MIADSTTEKEVLEVEMNAVERVKRLTTYHTIHINKQTTLEIHLAEEIVLECWVWRLLKVKEGFIFTFEMRMAHWTPRALESAH